MDDEDAPPPAPASSLEALASALKHPENPGRIKGGLVVEAGAAQPCALPHLVLGRHNSSMLCVLRGRTLTTGRPSTRCYATKMSCRAWAPGR
jgi:hypothetical protein